MGGHLHQRARKWRRDQSVRWDEKRLTAYTEYSHAVKQVISAATRLEEQRRGGGAGTTSADVKTALAAGEASLTAAADERTVKWESVLMLGSGDVNSRPAHGIKARSALSGSPSATQATCHGMKRSRRLARRGARTTKAQRRTSASASAARLRLTSGS
jgi:hypothetical protein